jgi:ferrous iron transport protein B
MSVTTQRGAVTVALIGNPNTGKSTLFNALAGVRQRVGNYPGVTVEKKIGRTTFEDREFVLVDLPGTYSLSPRSLDEMIAVDVLLGRRHDVNEPDAVLCIVDASNLQRNLYLVSQVLELGRPVVLALNMTDIAREKGQTIDVERLRRQLPAPVVEIQANRRRGMDELKAALSQVVESPPPKVESPFPEVFQEELAGLQEFIEGGAEQVPPRYLVERLLLDVGGYLDRAKLREFHCEGLSERLAESRRRLAEAGCSVPAVEAMARYQWVGSVLDGVVSHAAHRPVTWTDRIDRVLTHKVWGTAVFLLLMAAMFQSVFYVAEPASWAIESLNGRLSGIVNASLPEGPLQSLLVNGVIGGMGGVIEFLPQIFTLFFFIAILEDCGYMARAAYLMDKLMSRVGLSGKSFIPLLSSFACAIPGIMATRVIENPRDRLTTILVAPLMTCSARLPVYTLLIAAFIPNLLIGYRVSLPHDIPLLPASLPLGVGLQGLTMFAMYGVGILAAVVVAWALKKTLLRGPTPPFVMELPTYKWPSPGLVLYRMGERGWAFVRRAGTLILAVAIVVWAATYYPHDPSLIDPALFQRQGELEQALASQMDSTLAVGANPPAAPEALEAELAAVETQIESEYVRTSYLGRAGRWIEPVVRPLGWDWRIGCAVIASFPAREVVIATLGVIYKLGADEASEESETLRQTLRDATWEGTNRPVFNIPVALSLMVFFALCAQCAATLAVMKRETNTWRWPIFTFAYMTSLAYIAAMITYQVGIRLIS